MCRSFPNWATEIICYLLKSFCMENTRIKHVIWLNTTKNFFSISIIDFSYYFRTFLVIAFNSAFFSSSSRLPRTSCFLFLSLYLISTFLISSKLPHTTFSYLLKLETGQNDPKPAKMSWNKPKPGEDDPKRF